MVNDLGLVGTSAPSGDGYIGNTFKPGLIIEKGLMRTALDTVIFGLGLGFVVLARVSFPEFSSHGVVVGTAVTG